MKCTLVAESKIFFGMTFGAVWMYDAFSPYAKISQIPMYDNAIPSSMCIESPGRLIVGLANGSIELFKFDQEGIKGAYPVGNKIKVPQAGEIYDMSVVQLPREAGQNAEVALATFSGLIFGRVSNTMIDGAFGRQYCWETSKVYLKDKMISQLCQYERGQFLVAEYSQPGYHLVDRSDTNADSAKQPFKILDKRNEHISGCTNLVKIPLWDKEKFPYVLSRNRYKIDLIDVKNRAILSLFNEMNTSNMYPKLVAETTQSEMGGHKILIYFNGQ